MDNQEDWELPVRRDIFKETAMAAFDFKTAMNEAKIESLKIQDLNTRKAYIETRTREIKEHADMLRKMSQFVNSKNKNR